ncbi:MAG: hypothetical protein M1499_02680 [Firmicutes bacterium]|nr:hypothetical protein [Bacillota bacterium]
MTQTLPVSQYSWVQGLQSIRRIFTSFPRYGVMWTAYSNRTPVVFYSLKSPEGYRQLVKYLARHPEWEVSFSWSSRRFYSYQRELSSHNQNWFMYQETAHGWKLAAQASIAAPNRQSSSRFVPTYS